MNFTSERIPSGVRIGVSPLSWANDVLEDLGADIPLATCLEDAAEAGYEGIELGRKFPRKSDELRPLLEEWGLSLASGWHSGNLAEGTVAAEIEAVASHARLLADMGSNVLVYGEVGMMAPGAPLDAPMSDRLTMPADQVTAYAERLTQFAQHLHQTYGLKLAYHHHLMMIAETFDEISTILARCGADVGLLLDTGHAFGGGFDYARLIERFGDRIVHIHLKDVRWQVMNAVRAERLSFNQGVRNGMFTVPGDGDLNFKAVANFVRDGGYQGWLVVEAEQDPAKAPPKPAVARAHQAVLSMF